MPALQSSEQISGGLFRRSRVAPGVAASSRGRLVPGVAAQLNTGHKARWRTAQCDHDRVVSARCRGCKPLALRSRW